MKNQGRKGEIAETLDIFSSCGRILGSDVPQRSVHGAQHAYHEEDGQAHRPNRDAPRTPLLVVHNVQVFHLWLVGRGDDCQHVRQPYEVRTTYVHMCGYVQLYVEGYTCNV